MGVDRAIVTVGAHFKTELPADVLHGVVLSGDLADEAVELFVARNLCLPTLLGFNFFRTGLPIHCTGIAADRSQSDRTFPGSRFQQQWLGVPSSKKEG